MAGAARLGVRRFCKQVHNHYFLPTTSPLITNRALHRFCFDFQIRLRRFSRFKRSWFIMNGLPRFVRSQFQYDGTVPRHVGC